jgi:hypothetical protein
MIVTLVAFIVGSVVATAHMPFWTALPSLQPVSLVKSLGAGPALVLNWVVFAAIAGITVVVEKRRHGRLVAAHTQPPHASPWLHGPWPLVAGAIGALRRRSRCGARRRRRRSDSMSRAGRTGQARRTPLRLPRPFRVM